MLYLKHLISCKYYKQLHTVSQSQFDKLTSIWQQPCNSLPPVSIIGGWVLLIYGRVKKFSTMAWWCTKKEERRVGLAVSDWPSMIVPYFMNRPWISKSHPPIEPPCINNRIDVTLLKLIIVLAQGIFCMCHCQTSVLIGKFVASKTNQM